MARTVTELIARIDQFEIELRAAMPAIVNEMAGVALSYTITQIRRNGGILSNVRYSDNPGVPAYLYKRKDGGYSSRLLNAGGRAYIDKKIKESKSFKGKGAKFNPFAKVGFVNWRGIRMAQGLQALKVDLTYTGRMFQNIGIIDNRVIGDLYQAIIGGLDQEVKNKLNWNFARYGNFLKPSETALELAQKKSLERVGEIFNRVFN